MDRSSLREWERGWKSKRERERTCTRVRICVHEEKTSHETKQKWEDRLRLGGLSVVGQESKSKARGRGGNEVIGTDRWSAGEQRRGIGRSHLCGCSGCFERDEFVGSLVFELSDRRYIGNSAPCLDRDQSSGNGTDHVKRDFTALFDDAGHVGPRGEFLQNGQALVGRDSTERFSCFVSNHVLLVFASQNFNQRRYGMRT